MASNTFGKLFRFTTWGESHGKAIGVVIDGCPAGLEINEDEINLELAKRSPGKNPLTSPRKETDVASIQSGVFEGKTTGAPVSIIIPQLGQRGSSSKGHAASLKATETLQDGHPYRLSAAAS
jgi:chorismate synthase